MIVYYMDTRPKMWKDPGKESVGYMELFDDVEKLKKLCPESHITLVTVED